MLLSELLHFTADVHQTFNLWILTYSSWVYCHLNYQGAEADETIQKKKSQIIEGSVIESELDTEYRSEMKAAKCNYKVFLGNNSSFCLSAFCL